MLGSAKVSVGYMVRGALNLHHFLFFSFCPIRSGHHRGRCKRAVKQCPQSEDKEQPESRLRFYDQLQWNNGAHTSPARHRKFAAAGPAVSSLFAGAFSSLWRLGCPQRAFVMPLSVYSRTLFLFPLRRSAKAGCPYGCIEIEES